MSRIYIRMALRRLYLVTYQLIFNFGDKHGRSTSAGLRSESPGLSVSINSNQRHAVCDISHSGKKQALTDAAYKLDIAGLISKTHIKSTIGIGYRTAPMQLCP